MTKFLWYFSLKTGVYLNGYAIIFDLLAQFFFMYNAGSFFWFEYYYPVFDFSKTIIGISIFILLLLQDNIIRRQYNYLYLLFNAVLTGIYSTIVWMILSANNQKSDDALAQFLIIFLFGYPYQWYSVWIAYKYYQVASEPMKEE